MKIHLLGAVSAPVLALCVSGVLTTAASAQAAQPGGAAQQPQPPTPQTETSTQSPAAARPGAPSPIATATGEDTPVTVETVVVTGSTSRRTLLNTSVAVTDVTQEQLLERAPRSTADVLDTIPGIYVQATAGPVSNNYSVRGLPGGGQEFVRLIEDGMPVIYGGLNDDEVFQYDLSIDHVEGLEGGTSGILTPNAAGASINFISRSLNYDHGGGLVRALGASYGEGRGDLWYSAPIKALGDNVAFAVSGYYDSTPGVRSSPFRYDTYHFKAQLEKKFNEGGYIRFTYKRWDEHDPYYADQPYAYSNGKISSVPSLDTQFGSIIGKDFGSINLPDSCYANECTRNFSEKNGVHLQGNEYRIDFDRPITDNIDAFARVRYTQTNLDFNGVFAGSGTGNGGLTLATTYLNPTSSPIASLLALGLARYPGTTQFGIRSVSGGNVIAASDTAALNALNGNGLLEQTVLNRQDVKLRDWGSDFGVRWNTHGSSWSNSLTIGGMVYSQSLENDQSAVSTVLNDVRNDSNIYDVVALNSAGGVIGSLTNNGLIGYGDWGQGISNDQVQSESFYFNDEFTFANRLHIDLGLRQEHEEESLNSGGSAVLPVPAAFTGVLTTNPSGFNGTYTNSYGSENPLNWTVGVNYTISPRLSVYGRYADSYETQGVNPEPTELKLYEAGVTFSDFGFLGQVRGFRTVFDNTSQGGGVDPANPNLNTGFFANLIATGMDLDITYRPTIERFRAFAVHAQTTYQSSTFSNANVGTIAIGGQNLTSQADAFYNGKTAALTPNWQFVVSPSYDLPNNLGTVYMRFNYTGSVYADNGNALALPAYDDIAIGGLVNLTRDLQLSVNVDNIANVVGLTEGNPRQGFTQAVVSGYFYGRGIIGTNAQMSLTYKF